jgi:hypothetical protein
MVLYFAYGSNMNPFVLSGRRNVFPVTSVPAMIQDWYLNFDVIGLPYLEPAFASIGKKPMFEGQPIVHGVLHEISDEDYRQIQITEGGGGHVGVGYDSVVLTATKYNGKQVECKTLVWIPDNFVQYRFFSSKRYMDLLIHGAIRFELEPAYIQFLESIPKYEVIPTMSHKAGRLIFCSLGALAAFPILVPIGLYRYVNLKPPKILYQTLEITKGYLNLLYYYVFAPVFGHGAGEPLQRNIKK